MRSGCPWSVSGVKLLLVCRVSQTLAGSHCVLRWGRKKEGKREDSKIYFPFLIKPQSFQIRDLPSHPYLTLVTPNHPLPPNTITVGVGVRASVYQF